jgi:beta-phosphoglucomutase-like phosphatase (HAD superfamily)
MTPDSAALDAAIRQSRHLLFAFDGTIVRTDTGNPVDSATPTVPYIYEAFAACRESGRSVVVISPKQEIHVPNYLDAHDLFTQITAIAVSVADAINFLEIAPDNCLHVTSTPADIKAAQIAGIPSIGYVRTTDDAAHLVDAGAVAFVYSMADLTVSLRARHNTGEL